MEDYNDYIIAKREYEVFSDGGYTIVKTISTEETHRQMKDAIGIEYW